ncbi:MAG: PKD domain-containing protein, partial [Candidatus Calescibacterium sp.]
GWNLEGQLGLGTLSPSQVLYPVRVVKKFEGVMGAPAMKLGKDGFKAEYGEGNNNNNKDKSLASRKYGCSSYGLVMFIPAFAVILIFSFTRRKTFFSLLLLFVLFSFSLFLIYCAEGTKFDQLKIQVEKDKLVLGEPVKVTVNSVGGSKGKVKLDMGDGKEIEANIGESVTHTYSGVGLYEIRAYSKDFASDRKMVFVNDPPSISSLQVTDLQGNKVTTVDVGQPFLLVLDCKDITGITKVIIDWGDGVKEEGKSCGIFTHSYRAEGQYTIKVEVQDEGYGGYFYSLKAEAQYQINVENMVRKLPFVQTNLNTSVGEAPLQVTLTIFVNSYDKLTNLEISWGDGKVDTLNPTDGVSRGGNFIFTASHTYNETGRYLIQVRAKDEKGREGFDFARVLVAVSDPVISVRYKDRRGKVIEENSASFLISDERFIAISGDINAADDIGFSVVSYVVYSSAGANYIVLQRESFFSNASYTKSFGSCLLLENELICSSFGLPITSVTLPVDMFMQAIAVKNSVAINNIDSVCGWNVCICSDLEGFIPLDVCRNIINNIRNDPSASRGQSLSVNLK